MKTNVYIDGYNFYYGCVKGSPYCWLDFSQLCQIPLPNDEIRRIKYFTALVEARPSDPATMHGAGELCTGTTPTLPPPN